MAKKIEIISQALVITDTVSSEILFEAPKGEYYYKVKELADNGKIKFYNLDHEDNASARPLTVDLSDAVDSSDTPFTINSFQTFARENLGFKTASGGSGADFVKSTTTGEPSGAATVDNIVQISAVDYDAGTPNPETVYLIEGGNSSSLVKNGLMDYNDTTGEVALIADTWTDVPNNGLGAFTNKEYKPTDVSEVIDTSTGYLDFSDLTLGSQLVIRNDFSVTPSTNNALLEVRYLLGQGAGEYPLLFWSERLDNGSGIPYQRVPVFTIYMGDTNTQGGVGKLQMRLSSNGTLNNAGSYINIQLR